jgi:hypothetical protein
MEAIVIARAWGGEPIRRVALEQGKDVVYLANPDRIEAIRAGESAPVGFPREDVFEFDEGVFSTLVDQWASQRATDPAIWAKLRRYLM